jgi:hypothetical protein
MAGELSDPSRNFTAERAALMGPVRDAKTVSDAREVRVARDSRNWWLSDAIDLDEGVNWHSSSFKMAS